MKKAILLAASVLLITACKKTEGYEPQAMEPVADMTQNVISKVATQQDSTREFIKTADVDMEVQSVYHSTLNIEQAVYQLNGFVNKSELRTHMIDEKTVPINQDSATLIKTYSYSNAMVVRVPQRELGNFLLKINKESKFLNARIITSDDVSLNLKASDLDADRINKTNAKLEKVTDQKGSIDSKSNVINQIDDKEKEKNEATIQKLSLKDQVNFATVSININEPPKKVKINIVNIENTHDEEYSSFGYSLWQALQNGFYFFRQTIIVLAYLWPFYIIAAVSYFMYRKYKSRKINNR